MQMQMQMQTACSQCFMHEKISYKLVLFAEKISYKLVLFADDTPQDLQTKIVHTITEIQEWFTAN
jgi:hypothetical protein